MTKTFDVDQLLEKIEVETPERKPNFQETHAPITVWVAIDTEKKYRDAQKRSGTASKVLKEVITKVVDKIG